MEIMISSPPKAEVASFTVRMQSASRPMSCGCVSLGSYGQREGEGSRTYRLDENSFHPIFLLDLRSYSLCSVRAGIVVDRNTTSFLCEFVADELAETPEICISFQFTLCLQYNPIYDEGAVLKWCKAIFGHSTLESYALPCPYAWIILTEKRSGATLNHQSRGPFSL